MSFLFSGKLVQDGDYCPLKGPYNYLVLGLFDIGKSLVTIPIFFIFIGLCKFSIVSCDSLVLLTSTYVSRDRTVSQGHFTWNGD